MRKYGFIISLSLLVMLQACSGKEPSSAGSEKPNVKNVRLGEGSCPYVTIDDKGNPAICWVQKKDTASPAELHFSIWSNGFSQSQLIPGTEGVQEHYEGMPKICFKGNGDMVAMYCKKKATPKNKYAAFIYYTQSFDKGKSWTKPELLVKDTMESVSQRFFDMVPMRNGEIGVIWLDSRKNSDEDGSSLYFASTNSKAGFTNEHCIGVSTCECCRTNLQADAKGNLHAVYRDIINDSIRDMVYTVSMDNGLTFSKPVRISADNWVVNGCPHTGPDMTIAGGKLHFVWFTAGGTDGVYYCTSDDGRLFSQRELLSNQARHPQITSVKNGARVIAYEELAGADKVKSRVDVLLKKDAEAPIVYQLTSDTSNSVYPVLLPFSENKVLVAWTTKHDNASEIFYRQIDFR